MRHVATSVPSATIPWPPTRLSRPEQGEVVEDLGVGVTACGPVGLRVDGEQLAVRRGKRRAGRELGGPQRQHREPRPRQQRLDQAFGAALGELARVRRDEVEPAAAQQVDRGGERRAARHGRRRRRRRTPRCAGAPRPPVGGRPRASPASRPGAARRRAPAPAGRRAPAPARRCRRWTRRRAPGSPPGPTSRRRPRAGPAPRPRCPRPRRAPVRAPRRARPGAARPGRGRAGAAGCRR